MTVKEFDEFVERQRSGASNDSQVNWDRERDEWLAHLEALYSKIESFLGKYISSGQIDIKYKLIDLNERDIGSYQARQMILRIGRQEVDITPLGTLFMLYNGIVEVVGTAGKSSLVLVGKNRVSAVPKVIVQISTGGIPSGPTVPQGKIDLVWKIQARPPAQQLFELTHESFYQLIMEVTNG